jgi:hypothetical protein
LAATVPHTEKHFVISLPRTGTKSTDQFFRERGFLTVHWPTVVDGVDYQSAVVGHESNPSFVAELLQPVIARRDVFSDVPFPALYRELSARYAHAKFILAYRNAFDWVRSMRGHHAKAARGFTPFERVLYWSYFPERPERLSDLSDRDLLGMHARHMAEAIDFFAGYPERLGVFDLDAGDSGARVAAFANVAGPRRLANFERRLDRRLKRQFREWWSGAKAGAELTGDASSSGATQARPSLL